MSRPHPFGSEPQGPQRADAPPSQANPDDEVSSVVEEANQGRRHDDETPRVTAAGDDQPRESSEEPTAPLPLSVDHLANQRYELLETLGSGGMGIVRRARDQRLNRDVAIKLLADNLAADPVARERFLREARAAAAIADACVVAVYDVGEEAGRPYLVMELVNGPSLADLLRSDGPLPVSRMLDVASDALTGLAATHAAGIIHRDVKPGNLLCAPSGRVKLTDLGVAEAADAYGLTRSGMVVGTRSYLAPERQAGGAATISTDLYALGVTLVELLFGPGPRDPRERVEEARWLPAGLESMLLQLLATDPGHRPRSAEAAMRLLAAGNGPWRSAESQTDHGDPGSTTPSTAATPSPDDTAILDDPEPAAIGPERAVIDAASNAETQAHAPDDNRTHEDAATTVVKPSAHDTTADGASDADAPRDRRSLDRRWRPILIGAAVVALFLVGLFWGSPDDGAATDDAPTEVTPADGGDAELDEGDAVPRGDDPATTARNLAEWLRER